MSRTGASVASPMVLYHSLMLRMDFQGMAYHR
jgi:hypothetical protein